MFIKMMNSLGKRTLAVYDSDSHQTKTEDIATNARRRDAIHAALEGGGAFFECNPYLEELAAIPGTGRKDKEGKMREHLSSMQCWDDVPLGLKRLMEKVAFACNGASSGDEASTACGN